jgi:pimeloyl-ACP methyl ester carboxylesterase
VRRLLGAGRIGEVARRVYRSWYVLVLCAPGGPTVSWRLVMAQRRWSWVMQHRDKLEPHPYFMRPTLASDGMHGSNLYRRNILLKPGAHRPATARVPVQLIIPTRDRFISSDYYEDAEQFAPSLRRRTLAASHWVPHSHPGQIAEWIAEFVEEVEAR